jgi:hypothetical protein
MVSADRARTLVSKFESVTVVVRVAEDADELASMFEVTSSVSFERSSGDRDLFVSTLTAKRHNKKYMKWISFKAHITGSVVLISQILQRKPKCLKSSLLQNTNNLPHSTQNEYFTYLAHPQSNRQHFLNTRCFVIFRFHYHYMKRHLH